MKKRRGLLSGLSGIVLLSLLAGCASGRHFQNRLSVLPDSSVLVPDTLGSVQLDVVFQLPEHYLSKRNRLVVVPQLLINGEVREELVPVVADASIYDKKLTRKQMIEGYRDRYDTRIKVADVSKRINIPYRSSFVVPDDMETGYVRAVISKDGCGECTGIDTIDIAQISNPVSLVDVKKGMNLVWIEPEFVIRPKIREGRGEARLQFLINRYDINMELGNNRQEMESMTQTLRPLFADTLAQLRDFLINGMASADGGYAFNTRLARNRAASAREWVIEALNIRPEIQKLIKVGSQPEGWWPVYEAMVADGNPDSLAVKQILTRYTEENDDVQERYIRKLPCWNDIKNKYLQKDRKVEYIYSYTLRSFTTDKELLDMYTKRPDAFNEDELLRVASLMKEDSKKKEVYHTLMTYFPQSQVAANNLAVLYLRDGEEEKARNTLERLDSHSPEAINTLAAGYVYVGDYERAIELLQEVDLPQARYNLGLLKARQRKLNEAYHMLKDFRDVNVAVVALSVARNTEAKEIMDSIEDNSCLAEYVRALIDARMSNDSGFYKHIRKACEQESLRIRAAGEPDFIDYRGEAAFQKIVE